MESSLNQSIPSKNYELTNVDVGSSDTDTDSAPIVKRPILIRGDVDFLKNFPSSYANETTYYTDNRTIEVNSVEEFTFFKGLMF